MYACGKLAKEHGCSVEDAPGGATINRVRQAREAAAKRSLFYAWLRASSAGRAASWQLSW